ncbi:prepilin-type N-terminal cleavage/methylation domain-containing protein [Pseudomonas subflava]|uniref:prepilin-type N-terminal cleavage/methylation domain-containing protein n=1 Tax=Pseudomonas subflava TaxID=2952933 RepID=UPI002079A2F9|nr:type II secretion system protein [Pseudomonas subflava]
MKNNKGFTLIELVVVIVILGILAAVALPRFMDATEDAHESAVKGAAGALASAVLLVRSQFELNRNGGNQGCAGGNCQIDVQGFGNNSVDVNADGWPIGTQRTGTPGVNAGMNPAACNQVFTNILQGSAPTVGTAAGAVDYVTTANGTVCTYTYQHDGGDDLIEYDASNGEVTNDFN